LTRAEKVLMFAFSRLLGRFAGASAESREEL